MSTCKSGPTKEYPTTGNFRSALTQGKPQYSVDGSGVTCYYDSISSSYANEKHISCGGFCPRKVGTKCEHSGVATGQESAIPTTVAIPQYLLEEPDKGSVQEHEAWERRWKVGAYSPDIPKRRKGFWDKLING